MIQVESDNVKSSIKVKVTGLEFLCKKFCVKVFTM